MYTIFLLAIFFVSFLIPRTDTVALLTTYAIAFVSFLMLYKRGVDHLFFMGLAARVLVLFAVPSLSDDYFRFLWDGTMIGCNKSPFLNLPSEVFPQLMELQQEAGSFIQALHEGMNSRDYFSVYPPINQWLFWLAAIFTSVKWGLVVLKVVVLVGELLSFWVLKKLVDRFSLNTNRIALYWLNPLMIIELCGNVHLDGLMLMFFLWSCLCFAKLKDNEGAFYFTFAALSKLFSLMFFPLVLMKLSGIRRLKVLLISILVLLLCYLPFLSLMDLEHMLTSFDLYFQRFEFNASLYYVFRYFGTQLVGYNPIAFVGPALAMVSFGLILLVSWLYRFRNRLSMFTGFLLINGIYLFFSPIVHPWYLTVLIGLSVFSHYQFATVWSGMIFLSYAAYGNELFQENYYVLGVEYAVVFVFLFFDLKKHFTFAKLRAGIRI